METCGNGNITKCVYDDSGEMRKWGNGNNVDDEDNDDNEDNKDNERMGNWGNEE